MVLSFGRLSLSAIFSFCLSVNDVNPKKGVSVTSSFPVSVLVQVCSTCIVGVSSVRFLLAKCFFSSSPCFPYG